MRQRASGLVYKKGKLLLIKHTKDGEVYYVLPGGGIKRSESAFTAMKRELREEIGMIAKSPRFLLKVKAKDIGKSKIHPTGQMNHLFFIDSFKAPKKLTWRELRPQNDTCEPVWVSLVKISKIKKFYPKEISKTLTNIL